MMNVKKTMQRVLPKKKKVRTVLTCAVAIALCIQYVNTNADRLFTNRSISLSVSNNNTNDYNHDGNGDDKFVVMHVGPAKTSTSTLQDWFQYHNEQVDAALTKDHYAIPFGNEPFDHKRYFSSCVRPSVGCAADVKVNYKAWTESAASRGLSIVESTEGLAEIDIDVTELMNLFTPHYTNIHVVVNYRRFYDWIHSIYYELSKPKYNPTHTFVQWLTAINDLGDVSKWPLGAYSFAVYNRYQAAPEVTNVTVVNMREENFNPITTFACDHMDNAPHLCQVAKSTPVGHSNPSKSLDWILFRNDIELYHSIKLAKLDKRWEKIEAKYYEMTDVPKVCLSPELQDKIYQISLEAEIALTPEAWHKSEKGLKDLKSDFEAKVNTKLCSLDIEKILKSKDWQDFLTDLEQNVLDLV